MELEHARKADKSILFQIVLDYSKISMGWLLAQYLPNFHKYLNEFGEEGTIFQF
jgi:hypothetical protein